MAVFSYFPLRAAALCCVVTICPGADVRAQEAGGAAVGAPVVAGVGPVTHLPLPRFVSLRAETANARRGPSLDQRVDWEFVRRGIPLEITGEYGNWRRVRDGDGAGGWVHQTLLSGVRTALILGKEAVALRNKPEEGAVIVAVLEPGVVARLESCDGAWCEVTADRIDGWLPRAAIWGVGPDETIE